MAGQELLDRRGRSRTGGGAADSEPERWESRPGAARLVSKFASFGENRLLWKTHD